MNRTSSAVLGSLFTQRKEQMATKKLSLEPQGQVVQLAQRSIISEEANLAVKNSEPVVVYARRKHFHPFALLRDREGGGCLLDSIKAKGNTFLSYR